MTIKKTKDWQVGLSIICRHTTFYKKIIIIIAVFAIELEFKK